MSQSPLKFVDINHSNPEVLQFERRDANRHIIGGQATAVQSDGDLPPHTNRICSLELLNISDTGLAALTPEPVPAGSPITIMFPSHGNEHGFDRHGHVVRCQRCDHGHEIGIHFDLQSAA